MEQSAKAKSNVSQIVPLDEANPSIRPVDETEMVGITHEDHLLSGLILSGFGAKVEKSKNFFSEGVYMET